MTGKDLLQAMNELEDEMLEKILQNDVQTELIQMKQNRKSKVKKMILKWSVAAVVALCCVGGGVAYAAKHGSLNWKYRYKTTVPEISYLTEDELSENIQAVKEEMSEVTVTDTFHNVTKTELAWLQYFDTVKEAVDFIDYDNLKLPNFPGTLENTFVHVFGNEEEVITSVIVQANYTYENVCARIQASLYVDTDSKSNKKLTKYASRIVNDTYTTKSGKKVCITLPLKYDFYEDYYDGVQATIIDGNIIYYITVYNPNTTEQDTDYLIQLIKDWSDQF